MTTPRHLLPLVGLAVLAGCTAIRGMPEPPRPTNVAQSDPTYLVDPAVLKAYQGETDQEKKKVLRNEITDERVLEIDHQFHEYEMELWRQGVGTGIGTDWVQLAVAGATATVGGESLKAALGAVSTGLVGAKASFDKNAFMERTLSAVMAQMVGERESVRANIERNKQLPVVEYTLFASLSDLKQLIRAGTIPGGIQTIAEDAGQKAAKADADIKDVRTGKFIRDDAGDRLRAFWKPDGKSIDTNNENRLKNWMTTNGLSAGPGDITMFLRDSAKADLRVRAVRELLQR